MEDFLKITSDLPTHDHILYHNTVLYCPGKASANGSVPCKTKSASVEAEPVKEQEGGKGKQTARRSGHQVDDGQGLIIARDFLQLSTQVTI